MRLGLLRHILSELGSIHDDVDKGQISSTGISTCNPVLLQPFARLLAARSGGTALVKSIFWEVIKVIRICCARIRRYYNESLPTITDDAYDALKSKLKLLEKDFETVASSADDVQDLVLEMSVSSADDSGRVGARPVSAAPKVRHLLPMLSLAAVHSLEELVSWQDKLLNRVSGMQEGGWW